VHPSGSQGEDTTRVADGKSADATADCPGNDSTGGLVLGLTDPAVVAVFGAALATAEMPPPARAALARSRDAGGDGPLPGPGVFQVHSGLGATGSAGYQQRIPVGPGDRVGVDDAQVHTGHPVWIWLRTRRIDDDWYFGCHVDPQPPGVI
jgi:hypothetical protein